MHQEDNRWWTTANDEDTEYWKILLFGDPGTGKTTLAATAHLTDSLRPVIIGDAEGGLGSLKKRADLANIPVFKLARKGDQPVDVLRRTEEFYERVQDGFKTVIVDTLSELQRFGLLHITQQASGWPGMRDLKKATIPHYGASLTQTGLLVRAFRDLPLNVIMITHVKRATYNVDGHDYVVPSLTGQQWKDAISVFDGVFFLYTKPAVSLHDPNKGVVYRAITKPFDNIKAKDRLWDLPVSVDITNRTLEEVISNAKTQT